MAWACHRKCRHCYEERFRPYVRGELEAVVREAERNFPRIVDHFPTRMTYLDLDDPRPDGTLPEKTGRIILSGGESLLDSGARARHLPGASSGCAAKYAAQGGVKIVVQTTGDILTDAIVGDLLDRGVWMISVASVDDFHVGLEGPEKQKRVRRQALRDVRAARHAPLGAVGDDAQLARGGGPAVQLLRRDARLRGSASCGRAGARGRTACRRRRSPTTSAIAGRAGSTSCATRTTARRSRSSPTAASTRAASRPSCRSAACSRTT